MIIGGEDATIGDEDAFIRDEDAFIRDEDATVGGGEATTGDGTCPSRPRRNRRTSRPNPRNRRAIIVEDHAVASARRASMIFPRPIVGTFHANISGSIAIISSGTPHHH
jgi:hypothetical protein